VPYKFVADSAECPELSRVHAMIIVNCRRVKAFCFLTTFMIPGNLKQ